MVTFTILVGIPPVDIRLTCGHCVFLSKLRGAHHDLLMQPQQLLHVNASAISSRSNSCTRMQCALFVQFQEHWDRTEGDAAKDLEIMVSMDLFV